MDASQLAAVVGRHCEAGDVLATDVVLPAGTRPGDLLAVACTGAYHHSMASNYNMVGRPPVVAVRDGAARLLVRRETASDMRLRDVGL
jgi:diaminopimelate decarboxylase